jgi:ABC-2 type transport system ATP-binding protein
VLNAILPRAAASVLALGLALALPAAAAGRDFVVRSFDGTPLVAHFFEAAGLSPGQHAPTVLLGTGWGRPGSTDPEGDTEVLAKTGLRVLRHSGYNTLTWDPRGFGGSGDRVRFDAPEYEARDVQVLIDLVSRQPEAELDAPGDPRVGMAGASYGGGIQLVAAAIDGRIDAIVPATAWHSLVSSFYKDETLKSGWMVPICGSGTTAGLGPGLFSPAGPQVGGLDANLYALCSAAATGRPTKDTIAWLESRGPGAEYLGRVRAPTLLLQSTSDTLITLQEAIANHAILVGNGVPTKMMWSCQGHGSCPTTDGPRGYVAEAVLRWFARYLKRDRTVETGPPFEWLDQTGQWHGASGYPLPRAGELAAVGQGTLSLTPIDGLLSGTLYTATPSQDALSIDLPAPADPVDVVGPPELELTYAGRAASPATRVFAQVVDLQRGVVAGHQATPIPLTLDGRQRTVTRSLEALAQHAAPGARYRLQLVAGTLMYDAQRSAGAVSFSRVAIALPVVRETASRVTVPVARDSGSRASPRVRCAARRPAGARAARPPGRRRRARTPRCGRQLRPRRERRAAAPVPRRAPRRARRDPGARRGGPTAGARPPAVRPRP